VNTEQKLENYCGSYPAKREAETEEPEEYVVKNFRRWIYAELKDLPRGSSILDVACGDASFTRLLSKFSADVTALHSCAGLTAQHARSHPEITFLQHDMCDPIPFLDGSFNVIWCSGILEHVPNPGFVLREMYRGLAPGGRLMVTVPYNSRLRDLLTTMFNWNQPFVPAESYLHFFTKKSLEKIARNAGFTSLRLKTCSMYNPLHDLFIPTSILLKAEKSPLAPLTVTFSRYRPEQPQLRMPRPVAAQANART
jgi:ubiquinone/menaquinone biosynthesis C-methylase UbiE